MSNDTWGSARADEIRPGDRIRLYGQELEVTRVDAPFLGRDNMVLLVESTAQRWACLPAGTDTEVERQA